MRLPIHTHTNLSTYERCPKQYFHRYVAKDIKFEETEASRWGNRVHKALELRLKGEPLPAELAYLEKWPVAFRSPVQAELKLGMTYEGKATGFFDTGCWLRGVVDVLTTSPPSAFIADWKTGKRYEKPEELQVHALLVRANYPEIVYVRGAYVWLKDDQLGKVHDLHEAAVYMQRARDTARSIEASAAANQWPANENALCPWCSVQTCKYWRSI